LRRSPDLRLYPSDLPQSCPGYAGICLHLMCRENLIVDITPAGSLHIPATPGRTSPITIPVRRANSGQQDVIRAVRKLASRRMDPVTNRVLSRADYLERTIGTVCLRWYQRELAGQALSQDKVGEILGVSGQRADQVERIAMRKLRRRKSAQDALDGFTGRIVQLSRPRGWQRTSPSRSRRCRACSCRGRGRAHRRRRGGFA
jgi:hypothetical protein